MAKLNPQNLKPVRNTKEAKERGHAGGIKSGEVRRQKKAMRETLEDLLKLPMKKAGTPEEIQSLASIRGKNITVEQAMLIAILRKAIRGSISAATWVRDTSGNKPVDQVVNESNVNIKNPFSELTTEELRELASRE